MKPDPAAPRVEPKRFPLLRECLAEGEVTRLFPLMKGWPHQKLNDLLAELETADNLSQEAWGELAIHPANFLNKSRAAKLDAEAMEITLVLSEICSVAYYFLGEWSSND